MENAPTLLDGKEPGAVWAALANLSGQLLLQLLRVLGGETGHWFLGNW